MPSFHPSLQDLPETLPVFPLAGALLLPQGRLPLNIFEPRYLSMTEDALAHHGRMLGMIQPEPGGARGPHGPALYKVGCVGRLASFSETEDGRFLITLAGVIRFRVAEELPLHRLYRRVRPDYAPFAADLEVGDRPGGVDRAALVGALRPYFRARGIEANWDAVEQAGDASLVTTLSMVCPFSEPEKQALLEAGTLADRAAMLVALMQIGAHDQDLGDAETPRKPS